jgi:DNA-binding NarL/FixJ family response regulator
MKKPSRSNLGQIAAQVRRRNGEEADATVAFRRRLVADLCKLLGDAHSVSQAPAVPPAPGADPEPALAPRLKQTLEYLLTGDSEKQIARKLALSQHTVHVYVKNLYRKFQVSSRGELLAKWVKR